MELSFLPQENIDFLERLEKDNGVVLGEAKVAPFLLPSYPDYIDEISLYLRNVSYKSVVNTSKKDGWNKLTENIGTKSLFVIRPRIVKASEFLVKISPAGVISFYLTPSWSNHYRVYSSNDKQMAHRAQALILFDSLKREILKEYIESLEKHKKALVKEAARLEEILSPIVSFLSAEILDKV